MEDNSNTPVQTPNKNSKALLIAVIVVAVIAVASVAALMIANPSSAPTATDESTTSQSDTDTDSSPGPDDSTTGDSSNSATATATITFTNSGFSPSTLTVKKGTKVTVVNNSDTNVEFSSDDHPTHTENPEMNTEEIGPGESTSFTATTVGTHGFHDHIDDSKTGTLVVTE